MEKSFLVYLLLSTLIFPLLFQFQATTAANTHAGPLIKHLSSLLKWTSSKSSPKAIQSDVPVVQFENGYLVDTVVEGNALGVVPHSIRVSQDGELFAVDAENSNIVRITPPLSQYSRARLVAGSFQGKTGHADGKANDARFNHPKGVTIDDKGNVYVADTDNLAIRKIGEGGVTTLAGGKSNVAGYRDGPSEDAKFSTDFDVVYVPSTCSLLVVDRGNAALRQISLNQEDCDANYSSISASDIVMVIGAIIVGYTSCLIQQGLGPSFFSNLLQPPASDGKGHPLEKKENSYSQSAKQDQVAGAGWPSVGQLVTDLSKFALEALNHAVGSFFPSGFAGWRSREGLTPLKDTLKMPEDEVDPQLAKKQKTPVPRSESWQTYAPNTTENIKHAEVKASKIRSTSMKDPPLASKHRSSKQQEYAEFYGTSEIPHHGGQTRLKPQKERSKHRHHRDKSGEVPSAVHAAEPKPNMVPNFMDPRFNPYNVRNRTMPDGSYRY